MKKDTRDFVREAAVLSAKLSDAQALFKRVGASMRAEPRIDVEGALEQNRGLVTRIMAWAHEPGEVVPWVKCAALENVPARRVIWAGRPQFIQNAHLIQEGVEFLRASLERIQIMMVLV